MTYSAPHYDLFGAANTPIRLAAQASLADK